MRGGVAFVDVLEEKLSGRAAEPARAAAHFAYCPTPVLGFFAFDAIPAAGRAAAADVVAKPTASHPYRYSAPRRPARRLSERHEQALGRLLQLGAEINADFTADELRSAFRALARQYHPDRHPGSSEIEKARLSRLFTELHGAYTELQSAAAAA